ncbi:MAG: signal peptide peptidase SppA [Proteobacteria bacterium]|nr:signal peptide peptidase SppA [Pseudomonadota bacterium]
MSFDPDQLVARRRLKRRITAWRTLAIAAIVAAAFLLLREYADSRIGGRFGGDHVAWLEVTGIIVADPLRQERLKELLGDKRAQALIVYIDSPGGTTYGGEELFEALREIAEEKPVVAVIGTIGTSAGYLVALASERIFARATSLTGSIGVLLETAEISQMLGKIGVRTDTVKSGEFKNTPSPFEPMTQTGRAVVQSVVDDSYGWFLGLVAERRDLTLEDARRLGDGRVYTGRQALESGLIDELGAPDDARRWLQSQHDIPDDLPLRDIRYREDRDGIFGQILGLAEKMVFSERLTLDGLVSVWHPNS